MGTGSFEKIRIIDEMITIRKKDYDTLVEMNLILKKLQHYGVDQWEKYQEALAHDCRLKEK